MINEFLISLFSISIAGSVLFFFVMLIDKTLAVYEVSWQYFIMRLLLLFFLAPAILFPIIFLVQRQPKVEYVNGEDIKMWVSSSEEVINVIEKRWNCLSITIILFWFAGFIIIFLKAAMKDTQTLKKLEILAVKEENIEIHILKNKIRKELGIKKNIEIYRTRLVDSPCLCGILKTKIFFPELEFSYEEMEFLLKHELYHYKRNDVFYNMLTALFWGINWFNPITWVFTAYLYNFCEISCDQYILKNCNQIERERYANLLINMSGGVKGEKIYGLTSFKSQNEHFMKRRLYNIMRKKSYGKKVVIAGILCSLILCPVVTYGSTMGVTTIYNQVLESVPYDESFGFLEMNKKKMLDNLPEQAIIRTEVAYFTIDPKATNVIDFDIAASNSKYTTVSVKKGEKFFISLVGDSSDKFKVVISLNGKEKKVVSSNNGIVGINDYQADVSGTYKILIKNLMTSKTINVSGSIKISN